MGFLNRAIDNGLIYRRSLVNSNIVLPVGYIDDSSFLLPDPGFDFPFYGINYRNNIYVGTNSYITFGYGSSIYTNLSPTLPGRGIFLAAADNGSFNGIYAYQDTPGSTFRIRFEGTNRNPTSLNLIWQVTLYSNGLIKIEKDANYVPCPVSYSYITDGGGTYFTNFSTTANETLIYTYNVVSGNYA